ncbi:unnamed protein product [Adineta steineri]|uniref:Stanniocalcin-like protein n=1 Tax=Adineta steineri TaxID=433720 RepID=A0A818TCN6_9BILA|nr:unnamed protein product [Adineta steineri]CAF3682851.1 unnamed protein product [Adineta steineri]
MTMYFMLFISLCTIRFCESHIVQATQPINQTCLNFGSDYDCQFYSCFEERFPCGSKYWMLKWGHKYCTRTQKSLLNFDKNGQKLLQQISNCLTNKLLKQRYYTLNKVNCEQLRLAGQRILHECYMLNSKLFCNAFQGKNRDCFFQLIDDDDRRDLTVIRTLTSVGQKCTPKKKLADMRPSGKINQCVLTPTL